MRSSIVYCLLLFISFSLLAFQPPEQPKSKLVTFEGLRQEKEKNRGSYLSLLPRDLLKKTHDYLPDNLEEAVHAIRAHYLNDPEKKETFLNDEALNEQLINDLTYRFKVDDSEHFTRVYNQESALLLNTPASFTWLRKSIPEDKALSATIVFGVLEAYLKKIKLNYQQALHYIKQYLENSQKSKIAYSLSDVTLNIVHYLVNHFNEPQKDVLIPEIKVLADIATKDALEWITLILKVHPDYPPENERFLRVLLKSQTNHFNNGHYEPVRNAVCLSLASLLTVALHNNDHDHVTFIKKVLASVNEPKPSYKTCINERLKWLLNPNSELTVAQLVDAITHKQIDVIRTLLEGPYVNVNACDQFGHNALWYARNLDTDAGTRLAIIELLQQAGAQEEGVCAIQ